MSAGWSLSILGSHGIKEIWRVAGDSRLDGRVARKFLSCWVRSHGGQDCPRELERRYQGSIVVAQILSQSKDWSCVDQDALNRMLPGICTEVAANPLL